MMEQYREASVAPRNTEAPGYMQWRLLFTASNDPSYVTIAEINFREVLGVDSAMDGTLTASSTYDANYTAAKAVDNSAATAWICIANQHIGSWWKMVTAGERKVKQVKLQAFNTGPGAAQMPSAFKLQHSEDGGTSWVDDLVVTGQTGWAASEVRTFNV